MVKKTAFPPVTASMKIVWDARLRPQWMSSKLVNQLDNTPVLLNRLAVEADGVILVNRVKPHTSFRGQF